MSADFKSQDVRQGLLLTDDLIFSTKVTGTAALLGCAVAVTSDIDRAAELCRSERPGCVLLDLGMANLQIGEAVRRLDLASGGAPVVAYGSHVDRHRLDAAAKAGCREVLPRSRFSGTLPDLLRRYLAGENVH